MYFVGAWNMSSKTSFLLSAFFNLLFAVWKSFFPKNTLSDANNWYVYLNFSLIFIRQINILMHLGGARRLFTTDYRKLVYFSVDIVIVSIYFSCRCAATNIISIVLHARRNGIQILASLDPYVAGDGKKLFWSAFFCHRENGDVTTEPPYVRSPFCKHKDNATFFSLQRTAHCDLQSRMKLFSLRSKTHPPHLMTSAGISSGSTALLSLRLSMVFVTSSKVWDERQCWYLIQKGWVGGMAVVYQGVKLHW